MKNKKIILIIIVLIIILIAFTWKYFYEKSDLSVPETWIVKIGNSEYDLDKIWEIQPIKTIGEWFFYDYSGYWYSQEYNYEKQIYETTPQEEKDFHAKWYPISYNIAAYYPLADENFSNYSNISITFDKDKILNDGWDWWSKIKFHNWFQKFHLDYVVMSRWTDNCEGKSCESWNIYLPTATKNQVTKFLMEINQEDIVKSAWANINEFWE